MILKVSSTPRDSVKREWADPFPARLCTRRVRREQAATKSSEPGTAMAGMQTELTQPQLPGWGTPQS